MSLDAEDTKALRLQWLLSRALVAPVSVAVAAIARFYFGYRLDNNINALRAEIWEKLADAYHSILGFVSPMQSYPDLDRMNSQELEYFLESSAIPEYQKEEIKCSSKKLDIYIRIRFWESFNIVDKKGFDFDQYFLINRMFVREDIKTLVEKLSEMMWKALSEKKIEKEYPDPRPGRWEKSEIFLKDGKDIFDEIGRTIELRLWNSTDV